MKELIRKKRGKCDSFTKKLTIGKKKITDKKTIAETI